MSLRKAGTSDKAAVLPTANIPQLLDAARIVRESNRKLRRSRVLFRGNSIVALVSRFDHFFSAILRFALRQRPERLESLSLSYIEAAKASSIEELRNRFVVKEAEDQMRESHTKQFKYLSFFTGDFDEPKLWAPFIEITERRNLYVHTGGRISAQYLEVCRAAGEKIPSGFCEGLFLPVDSAYFKRSCLVISEMAFKLGQTILRKFFSKESNIADTSLLSIGLDLIRDENYKLAEVVYDYAANLKENWISDDKMRKTFTINRALVLKSLKKDKESLILLSKTDWTSAHPKFLLAVHLLRDETKEAAKVLSSLLKLGDLTEKQLLDWPIFKGFRESEECAVAFQAVHHRPLGLTRASSPPHPIGPKPPASSEAILPTE